MNSQSECMWVFVKERAKDNMLIIPLRHDDDLFLQSWDINCIHFLKAVLMYKCCEVLKPNKKKTIGKLLGTYDSCVKRGSVTNV